jgi:hypothetical protein
MISACAPEEYGEENMNSNSADWSDWISLHREVRIPSSLCSLVSAASCFSTPTSPLVVMSDAVSSANILPDGARRASRAPVVFDQSSIGVQPLQPTIEEQLDQAEQEEQKEEHEANNKHGDEQPVDAPAPAASALPAPAAASVPALDVIGMLRAMEERMAYLTSVVATMAAVTVAPRPSVVQANQYVQSLVNMNNGVAVQYPNNLGLLASAVPAVVPSQPAHLTGGSSSSAQSASRMDAVMNGVQRAGSALGQASEQDLSAMLNQLFAAERSNGTDLSNMQVSQNNKTREISSSSSPISTPSPILDAPVGAGGIPKVFYRPAARTDLTLVDMLSGLTERTAQTAVGWMETTE